MKSKTATTKTVTTPATAVVNNTQPTANALDKLEAAFKASLREPAAIIAEIRARKLYEPKYASFTDYAAKRLKIHVPVVWNAVWTAATALVEKENKAAAPKADAKPAPKPAKKTSPLKGTKVSAEPVVEV